MSGSRLLEICALACVAGACTRVVDAVIPIGSGMVCTQQSAEPDCAPTPWPTLDGMHKANSDPWLVTHNQVITSMSPSVLVLNFDTAQSTSQTTDYVKNQIIAALAAGSTYHGYSDSAATPFLTYQIAKVVDLTAVAPPVVSGSPYLLDPTALFSDPTFPPLYGFSDGNGGYLSLCDLFEKGVVNEVWIQDGGDAQTTPRAPLYAERKQIYGDDGFAVPGAFEKNIGGFVGGGADFSLSVSCKVTVRLAHLDPSPNGGAGCDVMVRGWGIEGMWSALPSELATEAYAFLNHDFNTQFNLSGFGWPEICASAAPCVSYPSPTHATSAPMAPSFDVPNFLQGCGNVLYPPNATESYDFDNATDQVESRCEGFGLGGGPNGGDQYKIYVADQIIAAYDQTYTGNSRSCPAGWQVYWRQSMPGYQNQAKLTDGSPMPNWWPMLFY